MSLASPGPIQGGLPFGAGGAGMMAAAGGGPLGAQYAEAYNSALAQNQANYSNILQGYQNTMAAQTTNQNAIAGGYTQLANNIVQGLGQQGNATLGALVGGGQNIVGGYGQLGQNIQNTIQGIGASQLQAIQDAYKQQSGAMTQQMLNSGLGNTTVLGQMQRGPMLDAQKAQVALSNQLAQLSAGYQAQIGQGQLNYEDVLNQQAQAQRNLNSQNFAQYSNQLGQAGLQYANQAAMQNTGLAQNQLGWMNSIQSLYPNAQAYGQLLGQQGQFAQMNADRAQMASQYADQQRVQQLALGRGLGRGGAGFVNSSGIGSFNPGGGLMGINNLSSQIGSPGMFAGIEGPQGQLAPIYANQLGQQQGGGFDWGSVAANAANGAATGAAMGGIPSAGSLPDMNLF